MTPEDAEKILAALGLSSNQYKQIPIEYAFTFPPDKPPLPGFTRHTYLYAVQRDVWDKADIEIKMKALKEYFGAWNLSLVECPLYNDQWVGYRLWMDILDEKGLDGKAEI